MTDLLAFAIILAVAYLGRRRGAVGMALLAGGLLGGYVAALLLFRPVGRLIGWLSGLPGIVTYPVAGLLVLVVVSALIGRFARMHRRERAFKIENGWEPPPADEWGGLALGGAYGLAVALIVAWAGMSLGGLYGGREMEGVRSSVTGRVSTGTTRRAVAVGARSVVGDRFVAEGAGRMIADPYRAIEGLNDVMADTRMQDLLRSGALQEAARTADPGALARNPSLVALAGDERFASAMRTFGLVGRGSGPLDPNLLAESIVREAGPALRSVDALVDDADVRDVLESPSFRGPWEQGDFVRLVRQAEFRRLFDSVLTELRRGR